jgi:SWI/SNF-related matrix-associated actin-dependent regulator 1 of chromatin subfamily A
LIFCHHRAVMDGIAKMLTQRGEDFIRIDGQTASKERHGRVQLFQTSSQCRVAVLAITAAGIALTLTAASTVYFAELFWTPAALLQVLSTPCQSFVCTVPTFDGLTILIGGGQGSPNWSG